MPKILKKLSDTITFGKYKGMKVSDVLEEDASYLDWLVNKTNKTAFSKDLIQVIKKEAESQDNDYYVDECDESYEVWDTEI